MQFLLNLFGFNSVAYLTKKSQNVFNVFVKTTNRLRAVNEKIASEQEKKTQKILNLRAEQDILSKQVGTNANMIAKLENFLK